MDQFETLMKASTRYTLRTILASHRCPDVSALCVVNNSGTWSDSHAFRHVLWILFIATEHLTCTENQPVGLKAPDKRGKAALRCCKINKGGNSLENRKPTGTFNKMQHQHFQVGGVPGSGSFNSRSKFLFLKDLAHFRLPPLHGPGR